MQVFSGYSDEHSGSMNRVGILLDQLCVNCSRKTVLCCLVGLFYQEVNNKFSAQYGTVAKF